MATIAPGVPWTSGTDDNTTTLAAANAAMEDAAVLSPAELAALASDAELAAAIAGIDLSGKIDKSTLEANSILYATTDDTPIPLLVAASRIVGRKASGNIDDMTTAELAALFGTPDGSKFLADDGTLKTPAGGGGPVFKQTVYTGTTNPTRATNSYDDIDATLFPALSLTLAVGDVVDLELRGTFKHSGSGALLGFDWLIDQPTSADTTIRANGSKAAAWLFEWPHLGYDAQTLHPRGTFVATEAGVHTFKPQWRPFSGTTTMMNNDANYFTAAVHRVTNLGAVAA